MKKQLLNCVAIVLVASTLNNNVCAVQTSGIWEKTKQSAQSVADKVKKFVTHRYTDQAITGFCITFLSARGLYELIWKEREIKVKIKEVFPNHIEQTYRVLNFLVPIALKLKDKDIHAARNEVDALYRRSPDSLKWMLLRRPVYQPAPEVTPLAVPISLRDRYEYPIVRFFASLYFDKTMAEVEQQDMDYISIMLKAAGGRVEPILPAEREPLAQVISQTESEFIAEQEAFNVRRVRAALGHAQREGVRAPEGIAQLPLGMQQEIFQFVQGRELKPQRGMPKPVTSSQLTKGITTFCVGWLGIKAVRNIREYQKIHNICKKYFGKEFNPRLGYGPIMLGNFYAKLPYGQILYLADQFYLGGFDLLMKAYGKGRDYRINTKRLLRTKEFVQVLAELHYQHEPTKNELEEFLKLFEQKTNLFYPKGKKGHWEALK